MKSVGRLEAIAVVVVVTFAFAVSWLAPASGVQPWPDSKRISARFGWHLSMSDNGLSTAWIQIRDGRGPGPAFTAYQRGPAKGWSKPTRIDGSADAEEVQLSGDSGSLLVKVPSAYAVATRTSRTRWSAATAVAQGRSIGAGHISADGRTVMWVAWPEVGVITPVPVPALLKSRTRQRSGKWGPEQVIGDFRTNTPYADAHNLAALSRDGSTVAWLNNAAQVVAATRMDDGTWGDPVVVQQYANDPLREPAISDLQVAARGSRILWSSGGIAVLNTTRTARGWAPTSYVMQNEVASVSMSPHGRLVAYGQRNPDRIRVRRFKSGEWTEPVTLGPSSSPEIVARNGGVAWVHDDGMSSPLRVALLRQGRWSSTAVVDPRAQEPALSFRSTALAWADSRSREIRSINR